MRQENVNGESSLEAPQAALMARVNELREAMVRVQAVETAGPILRKLADTARVSFETEEEILSSVRFPGLNEHSELHRGLVDTVED
jgi:hemerythrin